MGVLERRLSGLLAVLSMLSKERKKHHLFMHFIFHDVKRFDNYDARKFIQYVWLLYFERWNPGVCTVPPGEEGWIEWVNR